MIKAVFFDLYHTLVRYEPPRKSWRPGRCRSFGIDVTARRPCTGR